MKQPAHIIDTPPQAPPLVYSLAVAQAQRGIPTAPSEPLDFGEPRRPRAMALLAAAGAALVVLVVVIVMATRHGSDEPATDGSAQLVATEQPETKHTEVKPIEQPPVKVETPPEVKQPEVVKQPEKQPVKQPIVKIAKQPEKQPEVKQPVKQPEVVKQPEKQPEVKQPTKATELDDVKLFTTQYATIGAELKAAAAANPNAFTDIDGTYHRITFGDAVSTQAKRDAARAVLAGIHNDIAARRKK